MTKYICKQLQSFGTSQGKSIVKAYNDFCTCSATSIEKCSELFAQNEEIFWK